MQFKIGNYIRVSTEEQAMRTEGSLDSQRHRLTGFVDIKNMQIPGWGSVVESYIDDGYSAKDTNRPQLQRLLRDLKVGKINMVLVADYSRLSRSIRDFCELLDYFKEAGAKILSLKEQFDTTTAAGELMLFSMIGLAQFERRQISERVVLNFHSRALRGLRNGGQPALGFEVDSQNKSIWKINENEAKHVRAVFDWYLEENSLYRTARRLREHKIPFRSYSKRQGAGSSESWSSQTLANMLRNYGYAGLREVNKQSKAKDKKALLPHQEYQIVKAAWPAIVEEKVFWTVQKRLDENASLERARVKNSERRVFLLSHVARCGECGRALVGVTAHGRNNTFRYYAHRGNEGKTITCGIRSYPADEMEHAVTNHLFQVLNREGYLDGIEKKFGDSQIAIHHADETLRRRLALEIKQTEIELKRLVKLQLQTDDEDLQSLYVDQLKELKAQHQENQKQLKELEQTLESVGSAPAFRKSLETNLRRLQESWVTKAVVLRKKLVQSVVARLVFGDGRIDILYHSEGKTPLGVSLSHNHTPGRESSADTGILRVSRLRNAVSTHNQKILGSFVVKDGRRTHTSPEYFQPHKNIELSGAERHRISVQLSELYQQGMSLSDLARQTGMAQSSVREILLRAGIELRSRSAVPVAMALRDSGKRNILPYFGFCYFQGKVVPDQREYGNLQTIYNLWKKGMNPNAIAAELNSKKVPPRSASAWNRNSVVNILKRFETKIISLKGGRLELR